MDTKKTLVKINNYISTKVENLTKIFYEIEIIFYKIEMKLKSKL